MEKDDECYQLTLSKIRSKPFLFLFTQYVRITELFFSFWLSVSHLKILVHQSLLSSVSPHSVSSLRDFTQMKQSKRAFFLHGSVRKIYLHIIKHST